MFLFFLVFLLIFPSCIRSHLVLSEGSLRGPQPILFLCQHIRPAACWMKSWGLGNTKFFSVKSSVVERDLNLMLDIHKHLLSFWQLGCWTIFLWKYPPTGDDICHREGKERKAVTVHSFINFCANASSLLPEEVLTFTSHRQQQFCLRLPLHFRK